MAEVLAPAKLNLGLEILGKRADGYHELRTIFCAVSLIDRITISPARQTTVTTDLPELAGDNLVLTAISSWDSAELPRESLAVHIAKGIPTASGLGGASSDAASVLLWLANAAGIARTDPRLFALAASLGSDVPFFLRGGLQRGAGRGEELTPLPWQSFSAVIITPALRIDGKTRALFAALRQEDWSAGITIDERISRIPDALLANAAPLTNAFERPLYDLYPELGNLAQAIATEIGRRPSITGAGPSMYLPVPTIDDAELLRERLTRVRLPLRPQVFCVSAIAPNWPNPDDHA